MAKTKFKDSWAYDPRLWPPQIHKRIDFAEEETRKADNDFWALLALLAPDIEIENRDLDMNAKSALHGLGVSTVRSRKEVLDEIRARLEREKFDALKQADKIEYLFEKASKV